MVNKKPAFIIVFALIFVGGLIYPVPKVFATTGGGTATIGLDGGAQGASATVVQSTSHIFTTVLTIPGAGMTLGAASPTFTIPTGFTAPNLHSVAIAGLVVADGQWSVVANGGGCTVDSSPLSSTTVSSGQVITVDITADCASGNTITLTYKGTSAITMGATALTVSTADAGDPGPVTALIAGSPTITVTVAPTATPTATPTPTPTSTSSSFATSSGGGSVFCPELNVEIVSPIIVDLRRISSTSIFLSWGPYSGVNMFNVQYGPTNGNWLYNTDVTGFSTTINDLPANTPIWFRVGARSDCTIGIYGKAKFVGGPKLPNTGFAPQSTFPWYVIPAKILSIPFTASNILVSVLNTSSWRWRRS